jgi:hypothetical protein
MSGAVGVERIFPVNLPALQKIEINKKGKVRRARIFYFRELTGKKAKIKEKECNLNFLFKSSRLTYRDFLFYRFKLFIDFAF